MLFLHFCSQLSVHALRQVDKMERKLNFIFLISLLATLLLTSSCVRHYTPQSSWEREEYLKSNFKVHPQDIRQDLKRWRSVPIAWVGVIQETEFYETEDRYEVVLLMEHHYFDWKEENFDPNKMYYPSSGGEGLFQTNWYLKKSADLTYFQNRFAPENLAIVYARPDTVINEVVLVECRYLRIIEHQNFRLDQSDYIPAEVLTRPKNR